MDRNYQQQRADYLRKSANELRNQHADSDEQREYLEEFAAEREQEAAEIEHYLSLGELDA